VLLKIGIPGLVPLLSSSSLWDHFQYHKQPFSHLVLRPTGPLPCGTSLLVEIVLIFEIPFICAEIITGTTLSVLDQLIHAILNLPTSIAIVQASLKAFLH
jgi:hypothetical protein